MLPVRPLRALCPVAACLLLGVLPAGTFAAPTPEALGELTYTGIYETPVTLSNGRYEGEPYASGGASRPRVQLIPDLLVRGSDETNRTSYVLLSESAGGSGSNLYLAAVSASGENTGTLRIGDRVDIIALRGEDGRAMLELVIAGPGDAACCPTLRVTRVFGMQDGRLAELSRQEHGTLSPGDLAGPPWQLISLDRDTPVPEGITVTARFEDERVAGSAGCNRYFAGVTAPSPFELAIGPAGTTQMACPEPQMEIERSYLRALEQATQYTFQLGRLAIGYRDGEITDTLLFERQPSEIP
jgi:heat shock protein HslJ